MYVSPIAVVFNLDGVKELNLDAKTIGAIFQGTITKWNDPAITADNPDVTLPESTISPVHRSDDSGTTENFTDYLDQAGQGAWKGGKTKSWPIKSGEAAEGTSGLVSAVSKGKGTIGYADASQSGSLSVAKVKVGSKFVAYSPEAAAAVLDASTLVPGRGPSDIAFNVDRKVSTDGVYPIILVSYQIACEKYSDQATADLVKSWLKFIASPEGQNEAAKGAGAAPLSGALSSKVAAAIDLISAA